MTSSTPRTAIDYSAYPHIVDSILRHATRDALLPVRGTSRELRDKIDAMMVQHIVVLHCGDNMPEQKQWIDISDERGQRVPLFAPTTASTKLFNESTPEGTRERLRVIPRPGQPNPYSLTYATSGSSISFHPTVGIRDDPSAWPDPPVHGDPERFVPICLANTRTVDVVTNIGTVRVGPRLSPAFANIRTLRLRNEGRPADSILRMRQEEDIRGQESHLQPELFLAFSSPTFLRVGELPASITRHVMNIKYTVQQLQDRYIKWESTGCTHPRSAKEIVIIFHHVESDPPPTFTPRGGFGGALAELVRAIGSREEQVQYTLVGLDEMDARYLGVRIASHEPQFLTTAELKNDLANQINLIVTDRRSFAAAYPYSHEYATIVEPLPVNILTHDEYRDLVGHEAYALETTV